MAVCTSSNAASETEPIRQSKAAEVTMCPTEPSIRIRSSPMPASTATPFPSAQIQRGATTAPLISRDVRRRLATTRRAVWVCACAPGVPKATHSPSAAGRENSDKSVARPPPVRECVRTVRERLVPIVGDPACAGTECGCQTHSKASEQACRPILLHRLPRIGLCGSSAKLWS